MNDFETRLAECHLDGLHGDGIQVLQVSLTLRCNQRCAHCHVACSPRRTEEMDWATMEQVLAALDQARCRRVDLTGGAPELASNFRRFVTALRRGGRDVQVRTNLTVLLEPGMDLLPDFLADHDVGLAASMPCCLRENVDAQRGEDVYDRSVRAIRRLNARGYGRAGGPQLDLVFNPVGADLPPEQAELEADHREQLRERLGIEFTHLLTITNMPIRRFGEALRGADQYDRYLSLLSGSFNPGTLEALMCRHQVCVGWDGTLYDCDFNGAIWAGRWTTAPRTTCGNSTPPPSLTAASSPGSTASAAPRAAAPLAARR